MDTKDVKALIKLLKDNDLTEIDFQQGDSHIKVKRQVTITPPAPAAASTSSSPASHDSQQTVMAPKSVATSNNTIDAPTVGVFYTAKSPQDPPFVKPGDSVKKGDVVGVIEVMKSFVNVVADRDGVVDKVLVNNEEGVEYGQPLIQIK